MSIYRPKLKYYIYAYIRSKDTEFAKAGTPYYIGKGTGQRAFCKSGHNKNNVTVPKDKNLIVIMEDNLTEIGAYALERFYIRWYGKECDSSGILRNIGDGGEGATGPKTKEHGRAISKARTGKKYGALTPEHRAKIGKASGASRKGKPNGRAGQIATCPHCGKTGGATGLKVWHFNNCKLNVNG